MSGKQKIIAILPAYNAQKTIGAFVASLPTNIFDEIIIVDDASGDKTYETAKKLQGITLFRNTHNLGYGGNLKMCLEIALNHGADIIMELHPDGEYGTDGIQPALEKIKNGADIVLGNRFIKHPQGMYWQKIIATQLLSFFDNCFFGTHIPDIHQGFRVYTKEFLKTVNYFAFSNHYLFSFEIIAAAIQNKCSIDWVPVTARYCGIKRGADWGACVGYTLATFYVRLLYCIGYYKQKKQDFSLWFCPHCQIGYTYPVPHSMASYYPKIYWVPPGIFGWIKEIVFRFAQKRRVSWVHAYMQKGDILDVGSGSGVFSKQLGKNFSVMNIDPYYQGEGVLQQDFLTWVTKKKFDAIVFWESLEHVADPVAYLEKTISLLKPGGMIFIEYPRYGCLESRVFGRHWFHLDIPRHLVHFTDIGLKKLVTNSGYTIVTQFSVLALDYAPWGLVRNTLFLPIGIIVELIEYLFGQSPIGLVVAKKI